MDIPASGRLNGHLIMKNTLAIIVLFLSISSSGQEGKSLDHALNRLTIADSITSKDIMGGFHISNGLCGYSYHLDSNGTFRKIDFDCMERIEVDTGSWAIKNAHTLILVSNRKTIRFNLVKLKNFYFFLLPGQKPTFIKDLQAAQARFQNIKPVVIDNTTYAANYFIEACLIKKYYGREIEEDEGP